MLSKFEPSPQPSSSTDIVNVWYFQSKDLCNCGNRLHMRLVVTVRYMGPHRIQLTSLLSVQKDGLL